MYLNHRHLQSFLSVLIVLIRVGRRNGLRELLSYLAGRKIGLLIDAIVSGMRGTLGESDNVRL